MNPHPYMPEIAAAHGAEIDYALGLVHIFMLLLFVGWTAFFGYAIFRFRASRNPVANYTGVRSKTNSVLEAIVVVVEAVLLLGFSIPLWADRVGEFPAGPDTEVIRVVAKQFKWVVHYPGEDGRFGRTDISLVADTNAETMIGLDRDDADGADDIVSWTLHMPVDKDVVIHLSSQDVIHGFGIPHMRVKQDAIPGISIPVWFRPTVTTAEMSERMLAKATTEEEKERAENFVYEIACAQLCGIGHSTMRGIAVVHTQEEYDQWLADEASLLGEYDDF